MDHPFAAMEQGLTARQTTHTVRIEETAGDFLQYSLLVDGPVSAIATNNAESTHQVKGWTVIQGAVSNGADEWEVGGVVETHFSNTVSLTLTLDGAAVSPSELVSNTGGTHPSQVADTQCEANTDCAGDLLCENKQCVMPPLTEIPQCAQDAHCASNLVCQSGMCRSPEGGGTTGGGGGGGGSTSTEQSQIPTTALIGVAALALLFVYA